MRCPREMTNGTLPSELVELSREVKRQLAERALRRRPVLVQHARDRRQVEFAARLEESARVRRHLHRGEPATLRQGQAALGSLAGQRANARGFKLDQAL